MYRELAAIAVFLVAGGVGAPASAQGVEPGSDTYFPLATGNRWTYVESRSGREMSAEVLSRAGQSVRLHLYGTDVRLRDGGSDIDIDVAGEGFVPYYRFDAEDWTHRDYRDCDDGRMMEVLDRDATVETPAGTFEGCLDIAYATEGCIDTGTFREWWAPGVGRVKWAEVTFTGMETWELESYQAGDPEPEVRYWPLATGNRWRYRPVDDSLGDPFEWTVVDRQGDIAILDRPFEEGPRAGQVSLRDRGSEVDLELDREGFVLFYRFVAGSSWTHRDTFECDDGYTAEVTVEKDPIVTPAGEFEQCLRITRTTPSGSCADAGTTFEWWAPDVGLVQWEELNFFAGTLRFVLEEYEVDSPAPPFVRGDGNQDGRVNVSDPISVLDYLFAGAAAPGCRDAADVNDDGQIDIADPVYHLNHLFAGGPAPPPPAVDCGSDPTGDDGLDCATPPPCPEPE